VNGDELLFRIGFRKLPVFREAVKPRLVGGDRSHGATFFTVLIAGFFLFLQTFEDYENTGQQANWE
jgi:hypothetical protein